MFGSVLMRYENCPKNEPESFLACSSICVSVSKNAILQEMCHFLAIYELQLATFLKVVAHIAEAKGYCCDLVGVDFFFGDLSTSIYFRLA